MARRRPSLSARPPQVTRPDVGATSPTASRISVLLPEPFGPTSTVGAPAPMVSVRSRTIAWSRAGTATFSSPSGRSLTGGRTTSPRAQLADATHAPGGRVDQHDQRDEKEAEPDRERQVPLRGLERDRGGHRTGE